MKLKLLISQEKKFLQKMSKLQIAKNSDMKFILQEKKEEEKLVKELKKAGLNPEEIKQFLEGRSK